MKESKRKVNFFMKKPEIRIFKASEFLEGKIGNRYDIVGYQINSSLEILETLKKKFYTDKKRKNLSAAAKLVNEITGLDETVAKEYLKGNYKLPEMKMKKTNITFIQKEYGQLYGYEKYNKY